MILWSPSSTWKSSVSTRSPPVMSGLCLTMRVAFHKPGGSSPCCPRSSTSTIGSSLMHFTTPRTTFSQSAWPATVVSQVYLLFLDHKKRLNWSDNELEKPCMITAKRLDVLSSTNKENNFCCHSSKRSGCEAKPCKHFGKKDYNVQMQVRPLEQEADALSSQRQRSLLSRFDQEAHQAFDNQRENLVTEVTSEVLRRTSKFSIHVQNSVFKHYIKKALRNIKVKNTLDNIGT